MATLADIVIDLRGNTDPLSGDLSAARKMMSGFVGFGQRLFGELAGATGLNDFGSRVREQFSELDEIAKTADRLGIAAEEMAGLNFAAEQTGTSFSAVSASLQRMTRRLSSASEASKEAAEGNAVTADQMQLIKSGAGPAADAVRALGLDIRELEELTAVEKLKAIADSMEGVESQSDRVRIAFQLFDSQGTELLNLLQTGGDTIDEFQAKAEEMGFAFSRDELAAVEQANDAMNRLTRTVGGLAGRVAVELSPIIEDLADIMLGLFTIVTNIAQPMLSFFTEWSRTILVTVGALGLLAAGMKAIATVQAVIAARQVIVQALMGPAGWAAIAAGIAIAAAAIVDINRRMEDTEKQAMAITRIGENADNATPQVQKLQGAIDGVSGSLQEVSANEFEALGRTLGTESDRLIRLFDRFADIRSVRGIGGPATAPQAVAEEVAAEPLGALDAIIERFESGLGDAATEADRLRQAMELVDAATKDIGEERAGALMEALTEQLAQATGVTEQVTEARDRIRELQNTEIEIAVADAREAGATPEQLRELETALTDLQAAEANAEAESQIADLRDRITEAKGATDEFGAAAQQMAQNGAHKSLVDQYRRLADHLQETRREQELLAQGEQLSEQLQTAPEQFRQRLDELREIAAAGGLDETTARRALSAEIDRLTEAPLAAFETIEDRMQELQRLADRGLLDEDELQRAEEQLAQGQDATVRRETQFAGAIDVRSREGFEAIANALVQPNDDPQLQAAKKTADAANSTAEHTLKLLKETKKQTTAVKDSRVEAEPV